jgi:hypothetical protein
MDIVVTLLVILLVVMLLNQFVGINTPAGLIILIVLLFAVFGYHGGHWAGRW